MTNGVFLAEVQGEGVLLDVIGDRYVGLGATSTRLWRGLAEGEGIEALADRLARDHAVDGDIARSAVERQLAEWRAIGLLGRPSERLPTHRTPSPPARRVLDDARIHSESVSPAAVLAITRSALWARASLWRRGPAGTLRALQELDATDPDARAAAGLCRAQQLLRRFVHQGRDDCWPRSVALAHALRRAGVDARVCLGVRKFPFLAHAWVEVGRVALGEPPALLADLVSIARF